MTVPNPPQNGGEKPTATQTFRPLPTPESWRGVGQGLKDAAGLLQLHLFAQAEDALLQLLEFAPMEGKAWHMLGRCHQVQHRHVKALECFERAACCYNTRSHTDDAPPASARLARLLWEQGEEDEARSMLAQLLAGSPADPSLLSIQQQWNQSTGPKPYTRMQEAMA